MHSVQVHERYWTHRCNKRQAVCYIIMALYASLSEDSCLGRNVLSWPGFMETIQILHRWFLQKIMQKWCSIPTVPAQWQSYNHSSKLRECFLRAESQNIKNTSHISHLQLLTFNSPSITEVIVTQISCPQGTFKLCKPFFESGKPRNIHVAMNMAVSSISFLPVK